MTASKSQRKHHAGEGGSRGARARLRRPHQPGVYVSRLLRLLMGRLTVRVAAPASLMLGLSALSLPALAAGVACPVSGSLTYTGSNTIAGTPFFHSYCQITNTGSLINDVNGSLENWGYLKSYGTLQNDGRLYTWGGGTLDNAGSLTNTNYFSNGGLNNSGSLFNELGGTFNNSGTLYSAGNATIGNSGTFNNSGNVKNGAWLARVSPAAPASYNANVVFGNYGTLNNTGSILNRSGATLNNYGTLTNSSALTNYGTLGNSGRLTNSKDLFNGIAGYGGTLNNTGTIINNSGASLKNYVALNNSGGLYNRGRIVNGVTGTFTNNQYLRTYRGSAFFNSGAVNNNASGHFVNTGSFYNYAGATLNNSGTFSNFYGQLLNHGTLVNSAVFINSSAAQLYNYKGGVLTNNGSLATFGVFTNAGFDSATNTIGMVNGTGTFSSYSVTSTSGSFAQGRLNVYGGTFMQGGGTLAVTTMKVNAGAVFVQYAGSATVAGTLTNAGTITIGNVSAAPPPAPPASTLIVGGGIVNNGGSITVGQGGTLTIPACAGNPGCASTIYSAYGALKVNGGTIDPTAITVKGGSFGGWGTVVGNTTLSNGAAMIVGGPSGGNLHLSGNFTQTGGVMSFVVGAGTGGVFNSTLTLDPGKAFSVSGAQIVFDFLNGTTSSSLPGSVNAFFLSSNGASFTSTFGTGGFSGDRFVYEINGGTPYVVNFDLGTGALAATNTIAAVPEPDTYALLLTGLVGAGLLARRRRLLPQLALAT